MKSILFLTCGLLLSSGLQADEPSVANGQRLFNESRCLECHSVNVFTREDRKVKTLAGLESKVRQCDASLSTNWFDDQILDVVAYLNSAYYKFKTNNAGADPGRDVTAPGTELSEQLADADKDN
jgi:mono/diheme cytochrome c family protein